MGSNGLIVSVPPSFLDAVTGHLAPTLSNWIFTRLCWPTPSKLSSTPCPNFVLSTQAAGGHGIDSPSNPPRVRGNVRDAIRDDGVAAVGTGMCRLRRPDRRWLWPEGTGEASGLAGVAFLLVTFLWPRKEKSLAPARRAGETLSRAMPSRPARRQPCCQQPGTPYTHDANVRLRFANRTYSPDKKGANGSFFTSQAGALHLTAPQDGHRPSPATWRRRRRTGFVPGSAGRPLRS